MTRGQQVILLTIVLLLLGVTGLLVVTLMTDNDAASEVPTLAVLSRATALPTRSPVDASTLNTVPPTWTPQPTRTPPPSSTPRPTHTAKPPPTITRTFAPTFTPRPTNAAMASPSPPTALLGLQNPGFEGVRADTIPGWDWWAEDNFAPGGDYNPDTSFDTPLFKPADDRVRIISGETLQIDAKQHLKFRIHIFQTVSVSPAANVGFQVLAGAFSGGGAIQMAVGTDSLGGSDCSNARWGETVFLDQGQGVRPIVAPEVVAGDAGRVTLCIYAEPQFPAVSNAAFFDDAELIVNP